MGNALDRILEIWPWFKSYFDFDKYRNNLEKTYCSINNEASLRILSLLINSINKYNEYFQRDDLYYNQVLENIKEAFVVMTKTIIKKDHSEMNFQKAIQIPFEKLTDKDIINGIYSPEVKAQLFTNSEFETNFLKKYDSVKNLISLMTLDQKNQIITSTIKFIYISLKKMKKKLPYNNEVINLSQIIYFEDDFKAEKWLKLKDLFPNILKTPKMRDELVREIEKMEYNYKKLKTKYFNPTHDISFIEVWNHLKPTYPNMCELARALIVLPYSSVSVERIFSSLKDIKTKKRSRLTTENLESCLLGYQHFRTEALQITEKMIEDYEASKKVSIQASKKILSQPMPEERKVQEENKSQEMGQMIGQKDENVSEVIERNIDGLNDVPENVIEEEADNFEDDAVYERILLDIRSGVLKRSKNTEKGIGKTKKVKIER